MDIGNYDIYLQQRVAELSSSIVKVDDLGIRQPIGIGNTMLFGAYVDKSFKEGGIKVVDIPKNAPALLNKNKKDLLDLLKLRGTVTPNISLLGCPVEKIESRKFTSLNQVTENDNKKFNGRDNLRDIVFAANQEVINLVGNLPPLDLTVIEVRSAIAHLIRETDNQFDFYDYQNNLSSIVKVNSGTLYIQRRGSENAPKFIMGYNPEFISKAALYDYILKAAGMKTHTDYRGIVDTLAYGVGHELLHFIFNHLSVTTNRSYSKIHGNIIYPFHEMSNKYNEYILDSVSDSFELLINSQLDIMLGYGPVNTARMFSTLSNTNSCDEVKRNGKVSPNTCIFWFLVHGYQPAEVNKTFLIGAYEASIEFDAAKAGHNEMSLTPTPGIKISEADNSFRVNDYDIISFIENSSIPSYIGLTSLMAKYFAASNSNEDYNKAVGKKPKQWKVGDFVEIMKGPDKGKIGVVTSVIELPDKTQTINVSPIPKNTSSQKVQPPQPPELSKKKGKLQTQARKQSLVDQIKSLRGIR